MRGYDLGSTSSSSSSSNSSSSSSSSSRSSMYIISALNSYLYNYIILNSTHIHECRSHVLLSRTEGLGQGTTLVLHFLRKP